MNFFSHCTIHTVGTMTHALKLATEVKTRA